MSTFDDELPAPAMPAPHYGRDIVRLGVDLGGTKVEAALLGADDRITEALRMPNPGEYWSLLTSLRDLCDGLVGREVDLGIGIPGSVSPTGGLVRNCNSTYINGKNLADDVAAATGRRVRLANDANCFALSEAIDGAGKDFHSVFGAIIGTGVGGGFVIGQEIVAGAGGTAGEWGHCPLPWSDVEERLPQTCWCGRRDCIEMWVSGRAFERNHAVPGRRAQEIVASARGGEPNAVKSFERYLSRLGRSLALICNVLDPDIIVLGGGMSNVEEIYSSINSYVSKFRFSEGSDIKIVRNKHGDSSGVRGAAWLWPKI